MRRSLPSQVNAIDQKLIAMEGLTPTEDALYSAAVSMADKVASLQKAMQQHVGAG